MKRTLHRLGFVLVTLALLHVGCEDSYTPEPHTPTAADHEAIQEMYAWEGEGDAPDKLVAIQECTAQVEAENPDVEKMRPLTVLAKHIDCMRARGWRHVSS